MNKIFFTTFVLFSMICLFQVNAQEMKPHRNFDKEAFAARRNAFITAEMGLTPKEAADFIPLCNELQQKLFEAGSECRRLSRQLKEKKDATEADYLRVVDLCAEVKIQQALLEKEYYEKFKKILSSKKLYLYRKAENKFARDFMRGGGEQRRRRH